MTSAVLACVSLLLGQVSTHPELTPGSMLQGSIRSGEAQVYSIGLVTGTVAELVVEQGGTDLSARVVPPENEPFDIDARESGPEPFIINAETSGIYHVEIRMAQKRPWPGSYRIRLLSIRNAGSDDHLRSTAQRNATEAKQADGQRSSDKLRRGFAAGQEALEAWRALGDRGSGAAALTELATLHLYFGNMEEARTELLEALPIARESASPWTEAEALTNLGHVFWRLSSLEESRQRLEQAIALWRKLGNRYAEAAAINNLGNMYSSVGGY